MLYDRLHGFSLHYFEPLEDEPELEHFASLISVWRSKMDGKNIPKWSDFDFTDFRGWHSQIAIFSLTFDPFDYVVKLSGEEYNLTVGRNAKGMTRADFLKISVESNLADKFYEKTSYEMLISYLKGVNVINRQHIDVEFVALPLSDNGLHATHSIEAVVSRMFRLSVH